MPPNVQPIRFSLGHEVMGGSRIDHRTLGQFVVRPCFYIHETFFLLVLLTPLSSFEVRIGTLRLPYGGFLYSALFRLLHSLTSPLSLRLERLRTLGVTPSLDTHIPYISLYIGNWKEVTD